MLFELITSLVFIFFFGRSIVFNRFLFTPTHCVIVSLVLLFTVVMISTGLIVGLPRVQSKWDLYHELSSNLTTITPLTSQILETTTFGPQFT